MRNLRTSNPWSGIDPGEPREIIERAVELFHPKLVVASSFSQEDVLAIAMAVEVEPSIRVVSLDTGRLPEDVYACADEVARALDITIDWVFPDRAAVEANVRAHGVFSFRKSIQARRACCQIRKVDPLARALENVDAWITGQRRAQAVTRRELRVLEEPPGQPLKINPFADWSFDQVKVETERRGLPRNHLYALGYTSIGCAPCTRPTRTGEDERAGRWWWERAEHKECGLHDRWNPGPVEEVR